MLSEHVTATTSLLCAAAMLVLAVVSTTGTTGPPDASAALLERAKALHRSVPLIDGHNDFPWALREKSPARDLNVLDIRTSQPSIMTDIPRLRAGGVGGQFWSVWVPVTTTGDAAVTTTLEQIDVVHRMVAKYPDTFQLALTAADVEHAFKAGRIASLIGMEGGHSINNSLAALRQMYGLGARYMTLTHTRNTDWADSATDTPAHHGLTPFGEAVVHEMNRLGMMVDLSHVSPETMAAALRVSKAPVIFSHSSARALCDHPRNVPDDILREVTKNGGVVMANFYPNFIVPEGGKQATELYALQRTLEDAHPNDEKAVRAGLDEYRKAHPLPKATLKMVADHIEHIRQVAGVDHVGIGSDFDGIEIVPEGLEDVSKYPALTAELLSRGWSDEDVKKLLGLNVLRVMRQTEAVAASLKSEPPSLEMIPAATPPKGR
jgi:membrane dipeptidase